MATFSRKISMVDYYKIPMLGMTIMLMGMEFGDDDKDIQRSPVKFSLLAKDGIDEGLRARGVGVDDLPLVFECFEMGRPYEGLLLSSIEVGVRMIQLNIETVEHSNEQYTIRLDLSMTNGRVMISDRDADELFELIWENGLMISISQMDGNFAREFALKARHEASMLSLTTDLSEAEVVFTETYPSNYRPIRMD